MDFERPLLLLLAPASLVVLWLAGRGSLAQWTKPQAVAAWFVRALIMLLVAIAIAGPRLQTETRETSVIFVRDVSASISRGASESAAKLLSETDKKRSAEVDFSSEPRVVRPFGSSAAGVKDKFDDRASDIGAALEFSAALLPSESAGRIVLLSDGRNTGGDPLAIAAGVAEKGIELDVVPTAVPEDDEIAVDRIDLPADVREGEVFDLAATVSSDVSTTVSAKLYQNNLLLAEVSREVAPGESVIHFPNVKAEGRLAVYDVVVQSAKDTHPENNRGRRAVAHGGKSKALILDREAAHSEPLAAALREGGRWEAEIRAPAGMPGSMDEMADFDLVVLADVPASEFSDQRLEVLRDWVRLFGGGLVMTGGENGFGAGGYFRTPLSAVLPVSMEREEREDEPVTALLVILDRSGSMAARAGAQTKMALANQGAIYAMEVLRRRDLFGVFAVDTRVQDVLPLGPVSDKSAAAQQIAAIPAGGGGIYVYTSLAEAYPLLRDAQAGIKHIILFSDADDAEEKNGGDQGGEKGGSSFDLATALLGSRITLSVVALGGEDDRDVSFLRQLASHGGGRFYLTSDASALPRLFTMETVRATQSSLREDAVLPVLHEKSPIVDGIDWTSAPPLLGYNITKLKPGAGMPLVTDTGDPLLVVWRYGSGNAAAFTSDAQARWAAEWLAWSGYGKFWTQLTGAVARQARRADLNVSVSEDAGKLRLRIDASTADGAWRNDLPVSVSLAEDGSKPQSVIANQTGPGHYEAELPVPKADVAMISVSDGSGEPVSVAWARTYPPEFRGGGDSLELLKQISSVGKGRFSPSPGEIFRPANNPVFVPKGISPWFLALAVALFPIDVWIRRRNWGNSLPLKSPAL
jgi:uncharacterized membrane protein